MIPYDTSLGSSPGGWSIVAKKFVNTPDISFVEDCPNQPRQGKLKVGAKAKGQLIGVDLLPMDDISGVHFIQGDFLNLATRQSIVRLMQKHRQLHHGTDGPSTIASGVVQGGEFESETEESPSPPHVHSPAAANVIMSDILHNTSGGSAGMDHFRSMDMARQLIRFAFAHLHLVKVERGSSDSTAGVAASKRGKGSSQRGADNRSKAGGGSSVLLFKVLMGEDLKELLDEDLVPYFRKVVTIKPKASRSSSKEVYILALDMIRR